MPTQIEYALMSANVYGNYPDIGPVNPVRSGPNTLPVPDGWTRMSAASGYKQNDTSTGFTPRKRRSSARTRLALAACATALLTACGTDTIEWKEEVLLHDGRMIVVERKATAESSGFPNANRGRDLEFELHYKPLDVHWKGTEQQSTFEIIDGVAYLVVSGGDEREICKGKPPDHIPQKFLKHQDGQWVEIDQAQFPMDEANFTLYLRYWGSEPGEDARGLITWQRKASQDTYPIPPGSHMSNNIPRRPYKFREFFETNRFTCARFQQP
jgi:hypothetical protein